jgi:hypothetical protein
MTKIGFEMTRPLQKSIRQPAGLFIKQKIVEQASPPAKYSAGRLFPMIFPEVS